MSEHKNCECTSEHKDCECTKDFMGCQWVSDYYVPDLTWLEKKNDPLPQPAGASVCVSSVPELMAAVSHAAEGSVILIADGEYQLTGSIVLEKDGITLKGQSGDRDRVVILGNGFYGEGPGKMDQAILVQCACNITIADLTIKEFCTNGISVQAWSDPTPHGVHIHNVKFINVGERPVKINGGGFTGHIENGIIENCYFEVTKTVSPDRPDGFGGDYIAGIDAHRTKGWIIRDNIFINIKGATGVGRGAIFVWNDAYDTIIERNLIIGCDRGIALGNPMVPGPGEYW